MAGALIGALRVSLSATTTAFEAGMNRAQRKAASTGAAIKKSLSGHDFGLASGVQGFVAALSVGTIVAAAKAGLEYAGSLGELASTLGLTTRDLQAFSYAAGQVGISQEELQAGIQKLTISMGKAQLGSKAQVSAFNAIGISIDQLKGKAAGDVFRLIADRLQNVSDRSKRAAIEVALFGKAGAKLDNLLSGSEGKLSELSDAAEKLGIILSDEQIQKADATADKLEAMQTVLKARIAGVVADNAESILTLADSFGELVSALVKAAAWLGNVGAEMRRLGSIAPGLAQILQTDLLPIVTIMGLFSGGKGPSSTVTTKLPPIGGTSSGGIGKFLAGGGGGKHRAKGATDHSAEKALREAYQFDQEIRRANTDILRAKKDLAEDYTEQTSISVQILDAERAAYVAELEYEVASKGKTKAQAAQLLAAYDTKDALERTALLTEEEAKRAEEFQTLRQHDYDRQLDELRARADIAETASERRKIELELLRIAYEQKKQALQNIIETSKSFQEIEDARRDLESLNKTMPLAQQAVLQSTRGPMEDYLASLPTTAAKANEALERLQVQGFEGLIDSVLALSEGVGSATDSLLRTLKAFLLGLARLELQRMLAGALQGGGGFGGILGAVGSVFGGSGGGIVAGSNSALGLPGFDSGGSFTVLGRHGIDKNIMSIGGLPIASVSYGERVNIGNDNSPRSRSGAGSVNVNVYGVTDLNGFARSEGQIARAWKRRMDRV